MIKVSVIIPTFKRTELLMKCLFQLAQQDFLKKYYELIVVTDGPDIETKTAINSFARQHLFLNLSCYNLKEKKGPAAARNKGVEHAKGELIIFTDDDCLPQPDWISAYWKAYQSQYEKLVAFTGETIVPCSKTPTDYEKNVAGLQTAEFITANCAITKTAFEKTGGFDEAFSIAWREDSDMHFKLIEALIPVHHVKNAMVIHPVRKAHWGISLKEQKKALYNALLFKKHPQLYKQKITPGFLWNYYAMTFFFLLSVISLVTTLDFLAVIFFTVWLLLLGEFIFRRIKETSKSILHISEMIITSALIPFLSIFWTLYGSFKYKTLLL